MFLTNRNERGETAVSVLVGAIIGILVLGGFTAFMITSSTQNKASSSLTLNENDALQVTNRVGQAVQTATKVIKAGEKELVVQSTGTDGTTKRVSFAAKDYSGNENGKLFVTASGTVASSDAAYDPTWADAPGKVLARDVDLDATRFTYYDSAGEETTNTSDVKLVGIAFESKTPAGRVALKTKAALGVSAGASATAGDRNDPNAVDDNLTVRAGGSQSVLNTLANDTCYNSAGAGHTCTAGEVIFTTITSSLPTGVTVTPSGPNGTLAVSVAGSYDLGSPPSPQTVTFSYYITDQFGSDDATVTVTITPPPGPPEASDYIEYIPVETTRTFDLADVTECDYGNPCTNPQIVPAQFSCPTGITCSPFTGQAFTMRVDRSYSGPETVSFPFTIIDADNPTLDGSDPDSDPGDIATAEFHIGPSARPDTATVQADVGTVSLALLGNDRFYSSVAGTNVTISGLPSGASFNTTTKTITWEPDTEGVYTFNYTLRDPTTGLTDTAAVTVTVTTAPPVMGGDMVVYTFNQNILSINGGNGSYKVYRASGVNASGQPTGTVTKVCDSTDTPTANDCAVPFIDTGVALGSQWTYIAYDSRTPDPQTAPPKNTRRYVASSVRQYPQDPALSAVGSDWNGDMTVDSWDNRNRLRWTTTGNTAAVGIQYPNAGGCWGSCWWDGTKTDIGIQTMNLSGVSCPSGWSACAGVNAPDGTERLYQAYGLNLCTTGAASQVGRVTRGGVSYCPSPALSTSTPDWYTGSVDGMTGAWTDGNAAASGNEYVRAYQKPQEPGSPNFYVGNNVADSCNDVAESPSNAVTNCDNNFAVASLVVSAQAAGQLSYCSTLYPSKCYGEVRSPTNGTWVQSGLQNTGFWGDQPSQTTVGARAGYGGTTTYSGHNCNPGGCSVGTSVNVRTYPQRVTIAAVPSSSNQYQKVYSTETKNDGNQCWFPTASERGGAVDPARTTPARGYQWAACKDGSLGSVTWTWGAAGGADHFSLGGYQDLGNNWGYDTGGGACYNFGLPANTSGTDAMVNPAWTNVDGDGRGYAFYRSQCPPGQTYGGYGVSNTTYSMTANVYPHQPYRAVVISVAANGLRQVASRLILTDPAPVSFISDSPFCNAGVAGWRIGATYRPYTSFTDAVGSTVGQYAESFQAYWWYGQVANASDTLAGVDQALGRPGYAGDRIPATGGATWGTPGALGTNNTFRYSWNVPNNGVMTKLLIGDGAPYYTIPDSGNMTGLVATRSYLGPGYMYGIDNGDGWGGWRASGWRRPPGSQYGLRCDRIGVGVWETNAWSMGSYWVSADYAHDAIDGNGVYDPNPFTHLITRKAGPSEGYQAAYPNFNSDACWNGTFTCIAWKDLN